MIWGWSGCCDVVALTSTEAVILCQSGATLKYRRTATATPAPEIAGGVAQIGKSTSAAEVTEVAPAKEIDGAMALYSATKVNLADTINTTAQIRKPTPVGVIDAMKQGLGDAAKPGPRNADGVALLIPEDLSIPEFLRREPEQPTAQVVTAAPISKPTSVRITDAIATQDPVNASGSVSDAPKAALGHRTDDLLTTATPTPEAAP
jgi:hypothetical protein